MISLASVIADVPLFEGMDPAYVELLAGCASNTRFDAGEHIFRHDDPADRFYVIRHGHVSHEFFGDFHSNVAMRTLKEGDILGWAWLIPPYRRQMDARAMALTRAVAFDGTCLRGKCEQDPRLGYELMQKFTQLMVQTLRATQLQLMDLYGDPAKD